MTDQYQYQYQSNDDLEQQGRAGGGGGVIPPDSLSNSHLVAREAVISMLLNDDTDHDDEEGDDTNNEEEFSDKNEEFRSGGGGGGGVMDDAKRWVKEEMKGSGGEGSGVQRGPPACNMRSRKVDLATTRPSDSCASVTTKLARATLQESNPEEVEEEVGGAGAGIQRSVSIAGAFRAGGSSSSSPTGEGAVEGSEGEGDIESQSSPRPPMPVPHHELHHHYPLLDHPHLIEATLVVEEEEEEPEEQRHRHQHHHHHQEVDDHSRRHGDECTSPGAFSDADCVHSSGDMTLELPPGGSSLQSLGGTSPPSMPSLPRGSHHEVVEAKPIQQSFSWKQLLFLSVLILATVVAITVPVTLSYAQSNETSENTGEGSSSSSLPPSSSTTTTITATSTDPSVNTITNPPAAMSPPIQMMSSTLQRIRTAGVLRCGVSAENITDIYSLVPGKNNTMSSDLCRAIAAAIMGKDHYQTELIPIPLAERTNYLLRKQVDVLIATLSWTMDRDVPLSVHLPSATAPSIAGTVAAAAASRQAPAPQGQAQGGGQEVLAPQDEEEDDGLGFAVVYSIQATAFAGIKEYVDCAQNLQYIGGVCSQMHICLLNGTRVYDELANQIPRRQVHLVQSLKDFVPALQQGTCNVFATTTLSLNLLFKMGALHNFVSGQGYYSTEPASIVTLKSDRQWTDFCKYVILGLKAGEYHNISQQHILDHYDYYTTPDDDNADGSSMMTDKKMILIGDDDDDLGQEGGLLPTFQRPLGFGEDYKNMFLDSIAAVGHWGEIHKRRVNSIMLPRELINTVNNGTTGMIHSLPFGHTQVEGPSLDARFPEIFKRGKLRCAIRSSAGGGRPAGFAQRRVVATIGSNSSSLAAAAETATAEHPDASSSYSYSGMDVDYCLAIAASIFMTPVDTVEFVEVQDDEEGFDLLHRGEVDVLAGVQGDMERDVKDPDTGVGFSFTTPYFYNSTQVGTQRGLDANLCLATREDNTGFSEYVFWVVQATFYAEEKGITRFTANEMPLVNFYGSMFTRIFRDAISAVGSYGEIYERNVQEHIPRQGMNMLYDRSNPTPLFYIPPGIFV